MREIRAQGNFGCNLPQRELSRVFFSRKVMDLTRSYSEASNLYMNSGSLPAVSAETVVLQQGRFETLIEERRGSGKAVLDSA